MEYFLDQLPRRRRRAIVRLPRQLARHIPKLGSTWRSYPQYVESMVCRFVNASTADGYNPYRLTKSGFEWEAPEPDNPWANIGYWCDHQIIYLCKLLELSRDYFPGQLDKLLNERNFVYANVPYRIKASDSIFADPRNTVDFDFGLEKEILAKADSNGQRCKVTTGRIR